MILRATWPFERLLLVGHVNHAKTSFAQFLEELVTPDLSVPFQDWEIVRPGGLTLRGELREEAVVGQVLPQCTLRVARSCSQTMSGLLGDPEGAAQSQSEFFRIGGVVLGSSQRLMSACPSTKESPPAPLS